LKILGLETINLKSPKWTIAVVMFGCLVITGRSLARNQYPALIASTGRTPVFYGSAKQGDIKVYKHEEAGVEFSAPTSWKAEPSGETITITTPDSTLSVVFWVPAEAGFEDALKALDKELGKTIKNMKSSGEPKEGELNGMKAFADGGTGEVGGTSIEWGVHLVKAKKPLIVLSFAAPGIWEKHSDSYGTLLKSIKMIE
jgi:hypothetical protein